MRIGEKVYLAKSPLVAACGRVLSRTGQTVTLRLVDGGRERILHVSAQRLFRTEKEALEAFGRR